MNHGFCCLEKSHWKRNGKKTDQNAHKAANQKSAVKNLVICYDLAESDQIEHAFDNRYCTQSNHDDFYAEIRKYGTKRPERCSQNTKYKTGHFFLQYQKPVKTTVHNLKIIIPHDRA